MAQEYDTATMDAVAKLLAVGEQEGIAVTFTPDEEGWTIGYMRGMGGGDLLSGYTLGETAAAALRPLNDLAARFRRNREERGY